MGLTCHRWMKIFLICVTKHQSSYTFKQKYLNIEIFHVYNLQYNYYMNVIIKMIIINKFCVFLEKVRRYNFCMFVLFSNLPGKKGPS